MTHNLKIKTEYFERVKDGSKTFETRFNDRLFQCGDMVQLEEIIENEYTGRMIFAEIGFVLYDLQQEGYVTFSLLSIQE